MLFTKRFKVIEVYKSGLRVTSYLNGTKKAVENDIENIKKNAKSYEMVSKDAMIVWAD